MWQIFVRFSKTKLPVPNKAAAVVESEHTRAMEKTHKQERVI